MHEYLVHAVPRLAMRLPGRDFSDFETKLSLTCIASSCRDYCLLGMEHYFTHYTLHLAAWPAPTLRSCTSFTKCCMSRILEF